MRTSSSAWLDRLARLALWLTRPPPGLRICAGLCAAALIAGVLTLGATPLAVDAVPDGWDKVAHMSLHFVVSACLLVALRPRGALWVILACLLFATTDEVAQIFEPGRTASIFDWTADVIGAGLGIACVSLGQRIGSRSDEAANMSEEARETVDETT